MLGHKRRKNVVQRFRSATQIDDYERFEEMMKRYVKDIRNDVLPPQVVAMMVKELWVLWGDVEEASVTLSARRRRVKQSFEREMSFIMARCGLVQEDIEQARLNTTRTGKKTALPVFTRRFD